MTDDDSNLDRFGWGSGQLSYIDENGNKVRIGEISPEDRKTIDKLKLAPGRKQKTERAERASGGDIVTGNRHG